MGLDVRTVQRWRTSGIGEDERQGPRQKPKNALSDAERREVLRVTTSKPFRDKSPKQIVPALADQGEYIASEATFYRVLRAEGLQKHRGRSKPPVSKPPNEHCARGPNQVWSWDITYLRSPVRGAFYFLYLFIDVWSRKIVAHAVYEAESSELAAELFTSTVLAAGLEGKQIVLHQDNGAPMKGATLKATLERLAILASYSRPRVSDDNPFSEALFRTLKYRPHYPRGPFKSIEAARRWVDDFVRWYNYEHLHSSIGFIAPADRHDRKDESILAKRRAVYEAARTRNPERWARTTRTWQAPQEVYLNPSKETRLELSEKRNAA